METVEGLIGLMLAPDALSSRVAIAQSGVSPEAIGGAGDFAAFMVLFVVLGKIGPGLLLLAAIDAAGTPWFAVRSANK